MSAAIVAGKDYAIRPRGGQLAGSGQLLAGQRVVRAVALRPHPSAPGYWMFRVADHTRRQVCRAVGLIDWTWDEILKKDREDKERSEQITKAYNSAKDDLSVIRDLLVEYFGEDVTVRHDDYILERRNPDQMKDPNVRIVLKKSHLDRLVSQGKFRTPR